LATIFIALNETKDNQQKEHADVHRQLTLLKSQIEGHIYSRLLLTNGVVSYVQIKPNLTFDDYNIFCQSLINIDRYIRNITLIENSTIKYVYPYLNNEKAIGIKLDEIEGQKETFLLAKDTGNVVLSGPVNLVQGGMGLIFRIPIFLEKRYWGQTSMVINIDTLFSDIFNEDILKQYKIALFGKDGLGIGGEIIMGQDSILTEDPEFIDIQLPGGYWRILATPKSKWQTFSFFSIGLLIIGFFVCLTIALLTFFLLYTTKNIREAEYFDYLTKLPNRRLINNQFQLAAAFAKRNSKKLAVVIVDLNDFKLINDTYGHEIGDKYLIEFAERMKNCLRQNDFIFRIGDDEFMLFLNDLNNEESVMQVFEKIKKPLLEQITINNISLSLSFSIGYSIYPNTESFTELISIADKLLNQDKIYKARTD
jgi:diguanylate cyclase (GGDEF)-like protein